MQTPSQLQMPSQQRLLQLLALQNRQSLALAFVTGPAAIAVETCEKLHRNLAPNA